MSNESRFTVALTGGVASGKTAVAMRFAALGVQVVDADLVARELVAPGQPALADIEHAFGVGVLMADGALDRRAMRECIFADAAARAKLESILHPRIRAAMRARANSANGLYAMLVIPLLAESRASYAWVDRVVAVDSEPDTQRARLLARDAVTPALADAMLAAQVTRQARLALADDVIVNDGTLADLDARVAALHARYVDLAAKKKRWAAPPTG